MVNGVLLDDSDNDRRETIIRRLRFAHNFSNGRAVVVFDAAAQRKGQKFFGQRADEDLRPLQQAFLEPRDAGELAAIRKTARSIDRFAFFERSPAADRVEVLQREADRIHQVVAARAGDVGAVFGQSLAHGEVAETVLSLSAGTSGNGGGGGVPTMFARTQLPRITGDVRVAYEVTARILPCRSNPPR